MEHKFRQLKDGDTFELKDCVPHSIVCCDCGLVHNLEVKRKKGTLGAVVITVNRDNRATGQRRRRMREKGKYTAKG